jgi:large subunit ribosomal protein L17
MRHRVHTKHLSRTSSHRLALRRNMAQSLFQYGEVRTTLPKAKFLRPFVERIITLARNDTLANRRRVEALLNDRAIIPTEHQDDYDMMSDAQRDKVLRSKSGRRMRKGEVPAHYNKKKVPFVATSVLHHLFTEVAPRYVDRPGGYTRIVRLARRRIGDNSQLAILQLVGTEEPAGAGIRKAAPGRRKRKAEMRVAFAEGKGPKAKTKSADQQPAPQTNEAADTSGEDAATGES